MFRTNLTNSSASGVRLAGYRPSPWRITHTELDFQLDDAKTRVIACHRVEAAAKKRPKTLHLHAEALQLDSVQINQEILPKSAWRLDDSGLEITRLPAKGAFDLRLEARIQPAKNTALSGLYKSGELLCTQCEAEGFRRIVPMLDRPDNLATYRVTLEGDAKRFPVLLSNGNLIEETRAKGRHRTVWEDPFPKPSYLFCLVAGKLERLQAPFTTMNGREVMLRLYASKRELPRLHFALDALKRAMRWDEIEYGREYDLDRYHIVAIDDFNMGAMENKSLNVFNTEFLLADPATATDDDFANVLAVVGHEYFHNWSGNRVTCRDWFQLSLKEGFTVFREQQFAAAQGSAGVERIDQVEILRNHQFREDAGPLAHPVQPDHYLEINNFYTTTVYQKGAELVRMLALLLGEKDYRRATDHYFATHDGQAVTIEDFLAAMQTRSERDLTAFLRWYKQAGTPQLHLRLEYDPATGNAQLHFRQHCPATPGQRRKQPQIIPVRLALFNEAGERLKIGGKPEQLYIVNKSRQTFEVSNLSSRPIVSALRGFSAPVILKTRQSAKDLSVLMAHDDDPCVRWDAAQRLMLQQTLRVLKNPASPPNRLLSKAYRETLKRAGDDPALAARLLSPPRESYLKTQVRKINPQALHCARQQLLGQLAALDPALLRQHYQDCQAQNHGQPDPAEAAARELRDLCLALLSFAEPQPALEFARKQLKHPHCMTDEIAALSLIIKLNPPDAQAELDAFHQRWQKEPRVLSKWFSLQAARAHPETLERVQQLTRHPDWSASNPNNVHVLLLTFAAANLPGFHRQDGKGYRFIADWCAKLDPKNPQIAARLATVFNDWRRYEPPFAEGQRTALETLRGRKGNSNDLREIVERSLAG